MTWTRILALLVGGDHDLAMLRTAASLAQPFGATTQTLLDDRSGPALFLSH